MFYKRGFELEFPVMIGGGHRVPAIRRRSRLEIDTSVEPAEILTARKVPWCFYRQKARNGRLPRHQEQV
ncbi:uncharacterized protein BDV17DRAFT_274815 [Aspergillus undulatus]|uniref:uncharacterized protein n=1 Tax=Aspergillus undulatus TaxID=1810928 RepID=UPI003CCCC854